MSATFACASASVSAHASSTGQEEDISFADLIASSIHDMKNSLSVQISALEKISAQTKQDGDESGYQDLGGVIYQASRMNANLVQLLCLYKMDKSIYPVDIAQHSIADLINDVMLLHRSIMEFKNIEVEIDCPEDCYGYMDHDLIVGVLINALNNAYQYTKDKIRIVARSDDNGLEIRVEDNGKGYPNFMLRNTELADKKGVNFFTGSTGLGFYFSSRVAHVHKNGERHGQLIIENGGTYGGGCFVLRLP